MVKSKNGFIYTDNMKLAAYLMCKSSHLKKIINSDVKKDVKVFVFRATNMTKLERAKFLNGCARVEPNLYMERYRDLRSLLRAERMAKEALTREKELQQEAEEFYNAYGR